MLVVVALNKCVRAAYLCVEWSNVRLVDILPGILGGFVEITKLKEAVPFLALRQHAVRYVEHLDVVYVKAATRHAHVKVSVRYLLVSSVIDLKHVLVQQIISCTIRCVTYDYIMDDGDHSME